MKLNKVIKLRLEISINSEKYTTEMTNHNKYLAYQGWAAQLDAWKKEHVHNNVTKMIKD